MIIFIPGFLITICTFPGIILHEMAHKFFCDYYDIEVFKVIYFRLRSPGGRVTHERIDDADQEAVISLAPLLINSAVCLALLTPYAFIMSFGTQFMWNVSIVDIFLIWVGLSCGLNALPSKADIDCISADASAQYLFWKDIERRFHFLEFGGAILWTLLLVGIYYLLISFVRLILF